MGVKGWNHRAQWSSELTTICSNVKAPQGVFQEEINLFIENNILPLCSKNDFRLVTAKADSNKFQLRDEDHNTGAHQNKFFR